MPLPRTLCFAVVGADEAESGNRAACRRDAPPGFTGYAPRRRCRHGHSASIPHAFAPAALRALLASRGSAQGPSPPRSAWRPSNTTEPAWPDRPGQHSAAIGRAWRIRRGLLRQVVRMRVFLNAGGSCPSRYEERFTNTPPSLAMEFPSHASRPAPLSEAGTLSPVVGSLTCPASGSAPLKPPCGDTELSISPLEGDSAQGVLGLS